MLVNEKYLIDEAECNYLTERILATPESISYWEDYEGLSAFGASYLDHRKGLKYYLKNAKRLNPKTDDILGGVHKKIHAVMSEFLGETVESHPKYPRIGAHISDHKTTMLERFHTDGGAYAVTLPISIPEQGTGLMVREATGDTFYPYKLGHLYFHKGDIEHSGKLYHRLKEGEHRITIQGFLHHSEKEKKWYTYF